MKRNQRSHIRRRRKANASKTIFTVAILLAAGILTTIGVDYALNRRAGGQAAQNAGADTLIMEIVPTPVPPLPTQADERETPAATATPPPIVIINSTPVPMPNSTPAPTPAPMRHTGTEADYAFFWFTDTQYYSQKYPETFHAMTQWMKEQASDYNVKYAFLTGDIVNRNRASQWRVADAAIKTLEKAVPVFTIAGNHDVGTKDPDYTNYKEYFGPRRHQENPNIVEWYDGGVGRCDAITIDGTDFLFAGLGWSAGSDGITWLNKTLARYPGHKAILFFHDYMESDGSLTETGQILYEEVVKTNKNVFMVLCGHRYNCTMLTTDIYENQNRNQYRRVYNILMNYQKVDKGGSGFLALIRIYKKDKIITFDTYSPVLDKWYCFDENGANGEKLTLPVTIFDD